MTWAIVAAVIVLEVLAVLVWRWRDPDKADYGKAGAPTPDLDSLVSDAEIEDLLFDRIA